MRLLATLIVVIAVVFLGAMGYYWFREGSLQSAGAEMDEKLEGLARTTEPLKEELGDLGDATKETVDRATDDNDRT
jgi:hypothetical protein